MFLSASIYRIGGVSRDPIEVHVYCFCLLRLDLIVDNYFCCCAVCLEGCSPLPVSRLHQYQMDVEAFFCDIVKSAKFSLSSQ